MKLKLESIVAALLLAITLTIPVCMTTGCALTPAQNDGTQPNALIKATMFVGTVAALKDHPEWRPAFTKAAAELYAIESANSINFNTVLGIISRLPANVLEGEDAIIAITATTILLEGVNVGQVDLSKTPQLRSAVLGLRQGLELGLGNNPSPTLPTFSPVPAPSK